MFDEDSLRRAEEAPGYLGPLADDRPMATHARLRPFLWAILLWRGAVRRDELLTTTSHLCPTTDLRLGVFDALNGVEDDDRSRLELVVDELLGEEVSAGILRFRQDGLWVLTLAGLQRAISITCSTNAQLPDHLLNEQIAAQLPAPF